MPLVSKLIISLLLFIPFSIQLTYAGNEQDIEFKTLTIGVHTKKARKHIEFTKPLAQYLQSKLVHLGYRHANVVVSSDLQELGEWLTTGEVDLISETPFSALELRDRYNGEFLLRRWKKGHADYHSVIFVRKDSEINTLQDLKNKKLVLENNSSTSGFYLPVHAILDQGLQLEKLDSLSTSVSQDRIGFVHVDDVLKRANEISLTMWVHRKKVDAAAFSNTNWNDVKDMPLHIQDEMKIIHSTESYPRSIVVVRANLPNEVKDALKKELLHAHKSTRGISVLQNYQATTRFDNLPEDQEYNLEQVNYFKQQIQAKWASH
ncbi:phosphate/phosphite/phosphonate ABC transporter substrate-binding protein [Vibrio sp. ZSDZ34]|uniref:Phosphate/phosphite/phosphonate ABC transporter substrate-binding protein n=1 Tax=Vibrio gelatinilyticus TaxID=2893468 RepID=A0A9X1WCA1_9VIBR|nr:phosphate/phosphite/phosphonate ABC transporter substrate-binding protein [Vibrio gelatinilyticus]MCJ2376760.1 phosphate/phosphite/phosphonate ABC transporter substrate-binding protein [Vibrio gelatinilyticus]